MKTKEEVIKAAYGKHWEEIKDFIDENGWFQNNHDEDRFYFTFGNTSLNFEYNQDDTHLRPKELKGIEDNNGWSLVSDGLPKISGEYLVITYAKPSSEENLHVDLEQAYGLNFLESHCTHYRLKEQIKRPLYL